MYYTAQFIWFPNLKDEYISDAIDQYTTVIIKSGISSIRNIIL